MIRKLLPLFDAQCTPCSAEEIARCSYCANLCDRCFKSVPMNPPTLQPPPEESDMSFKFCSYSCYEASAFPPKSNTYFLVDKDGTLCHAKSNPVPVEDTMNFIPTCGPVADSHILHLHFLCIDTNWAGYQRQTEVALCSGVFLGSSAQQHYVVYRGRSLTGQQCLEFFISDDLTSAQLLPHIVVSEGKEELEGLVDDGVIQKHLCEVLCKICGECSQDVALYSLLSLLPVAVTQLFAEGECQNAETASKCGDASEPEDEVTDISLLF